MPLKQRTGHCWTAPNASESKAVTVRQVLSSQQTAVENAVRTPQQLIGAMKSSVRGPIDRDAAADVGAF